MDVGNKRDGNVHVLGFQLAYLNEVEAPFTGIQSKERSDFERQSVSSVLTCFVCDAFGTSK